MMMGCVRLFMTSWVLGFVLTTGRRFGLGSGWAPRDPRPAGGPKRDVVTAPDVGRPTRTVLAGSCWSRTTSNRTGRREATRDGAPTIDLVDGEALCGLVKKLGLGVRLKVVEEVEVDLAFLRGL